MILNFISLDFVFLIFTRWKYSFQYETNMILINHKILNE